MLKPEDFQIGRALGGLAKTLELAGKLEEALSYRQQALEHRLAREGRVPLRGVNPEARMP